jgi:hypothetical protein
VPDMLFISARVCAYRYGYAYPCANASLLLS